MHSSTPPIIMKRSLADKTLSRSLLCGEYAALLQREVTKNVRLYTNMLYFIQFSYTWYWNVAVPDCTKDKIT